MIKKFTSNIRKYNNQKGSALITVIIIISLLTILGTGLLMVSVTGFRRAILQGGANKAFYINDGAIEESLAELNDMAYKAEELANEHINSSFDFANDNIFDAISNNEISETNFLRNDVWEPFLRQLKSDIQSKALTEEEAIEYLDLALNLEFLLKYYEVLLGRSDNLSYQLMKDDAYLGSIENPELFNDACLQFELIASEALNITNTQKLKDVQINKLIESKEGFEPLGDSEGEISVSSSFTQNDGIIITLKTNGSYNIHNKALELKVAVTEPRYQFVFKTLTGKEKIKVNEILEYTVAAGKDLIITEGSAEIDGNAYFYGTYPEKVSVSDKIYQREIGGVVLGYKDTSLGTDLDFLSGDLSGFQFKNHLDKDTVSGLELTVKGDLYTRSNVKVLKTGRKLTVNGDLGANEFRTESTATENLITKLEVGKNMYLFEDIVLRGTGGTTIIDLTNDAVDEGELYLMHETGSTGYSAGDLAASIIVQEDVAGSASINVQNAYIYGVSFGGMSRLEDPTKADTRQYFMTGESLSIENKYMKFYRSDYAANEANGSYDNKLGNYNEVNYYYDYDGITPVDEHGDPSGPQYMFMESEHGNNDIEFKKKKFPIRCKKW